MKKFGLLATLVFCALLLVGCSFNVNTNKTNENIDERFPDSNVIYSEIGSQDIVGEKTIYYNDKYGISFRVWEGFDEGFVHEEEGQQNSSISFFYEDPTATEEDNLIEGYRESFTIWVVPTDFYEEFMQIKGFSSDNVIGKNSKYYFIETDGDGAEGKTYTDIYIFDVK